MFLLALLAALPQAILLVLGPLAGWRPADLPLIRIWLIFLTPFFCFGALALKVRKPTPTGPAATAGYRLATIALAIWVVYVAAVLIRNEGF